MTAKEFSIAMRVAGSGMALWRNMVNDRYLLTKNGVILEESDSLAEIAIAIDGEDD